MQTLADLVADLPAFRALSPEHRDVLAGCGCIEVFDADAYLLREGAAADDLYAIREGSIAVEAYHPQQGPLTLQTLHSGDLVGWSWLMAPHRSQFDARAVGTARVLRFHGPCLRAKCEADPAFGYALLKAVSQVVVGRLQQTRMQRLDVYGRPIRT